MTINLTMDLSQKGLYMFFKDYQVGALSLLLEHPEGLGSQQVWEETNRRQNKIISRASYINFLNSAVKKKILKVNFIIGKGGYRGIYSQGFSENNLKDYLTKNVQQAIMTL